MKRQGTIVRWNAERGFGFIRVPQGGPDVFFHVRDLRAQPSEGLEVEFEEIHVGGKGPRAMAIRPRGAAEAPRAAPDPAAQRTPRREPTSRRDGPVLPMLLLMVAWTVLLGWAVWTRRLPVPVLLGAPLLNATTFFAYWFDKEAAQQQRWRTREDTLHALAFLGGWPAAWFAQRLLRHKSRKPTFRDGFRISVVLHWVAVIAGLWWLGPT